MIKGIKVMLEPNNKQITKMFQYAGAKRFAYNWTLAIQEENFKNGGKFIPDKELRKEFTQLKKQEQYKWLNNVSNNVTKQAIKDCCEAYKKFFNGLAKHPKFKSKNILHLNFIKIQIKFNLLKLMLNLKDLLIVKRRTNKN
jgi:putative transposase